MLLHLFTIKKPLTEIHLQPVKRTKIAHMPQHGNPVVSRSQNQRSAFMASFAQSLHIATVCLHCLTFVSALNTQIHNNFGGTTLNIVRILQMLLINVMGGFIQLSSHTFMSLDKSHNRTERDTQGVGRDILIPKKLFLELCGPRGNSFR